jgi:hypothetical protein
MTRTSTGGPEPSAEEHVRTSEKDGSGSLESDIVGRWIIALEEGVIGGIWADGDYIDIVDVD